MPEFVLDESPKAVDFLKQYYISQEYQGGPVDIVENLDQYLKVDNLTPEVIVGSTTLSADITDTSDSISVSSTKGFPQQYGLLKIGDEIIHTPKKHQLHLLDVFVDFRYYELSCRFEWRRISIFYINCRIS